MTTYNPAILALAKQFQVPPANIIKQYKSNAEGLRQMAQKALSTGRKINGYTATELTEKADAYDLIANGGTTTALSAAMARNSWLARLAK